MGIFSKHHRFREAGEQANVNNVAQFGEPVRSLFTTSKVFTLHHRITIQLSNEFFHIIKDITNIEGLGWQLRGNILGLNFQLYDADGSIIAVIGQKLLSLHDKYCVDIYRPEAEPVVVAILVTLQHMIKDREARASSSSSSSSSGN